MYFQCLFDQFGRSLSEWISKHPTHSVCGVAPSFYIPNNPSIHVEPDGYFVVVKVRGYE
jgi:hypothetical protein